MTTAAPIAFGSHPVPENSTYLETMVNLGLSGALAYQQSTTIAVATASMPWAGNLSANLYHTGSFAPGVMQILVQPNSTPGPTESWWGALLEYGDIGGTHTFCPHQAVWRDLAKGTVVNVGIKVTVQTGNVNWDMGAVVGTLRMFRI
jgi:hypothetical protein